jgi:hypothetical protein
MFGARFYSGINSDYIIELFTLQNRLIDHDLNISQFLLLNAYLISSSIILQTENYANFSVEYVMFLEHFNILGSHSLPRIPGSSIEFMKDCAIYLNSNLSFNEMISIIQNSDANLISNQYHYTESIDENNRYLNTPIHNYYYKVDMIYCQDDINSLLFNCGTFIFLGSLGLILHSYGI